VPVSGQVGAGAVVVVGRAVMGVTGTGGLLALLGLLPEVTSSATTAATMSTATPPRAKNQLRGEPFCCRSSFLDSTVGTTAPAPAASGV
jgi:hypothetical protein